jgi:Tfp pilus assembly protein PilN
MPKTKTKNINLLPQEEFDVSPLGRVLKWTMGAFRIIVIVTEMVVMGAFLSRFWLDAQNSDLNDQVKVKTAQIKAQSDFENTFRSLQNRLIIAKTLDGYRRPSDKFSAISSKIPSDVMLSSTSISEGSATLKGISPSESAIGQFISNLLSDAAMKSANLTSLTSSDSDTSLTVFTLDINY